MNSLYFDAIRKALLDVSFRQDNRGLVDILNWHGTHTIVREDKASKIIWWYCTGLVFIEVYDKISCSSKVERHPERENYPLPKLEDALRSLYE